MAREIDGKIWLTVAEAAERAGVTNYSVYRWIKEEQFTCRKLRRGTRYSWGVEEDSFEKYITAPPPAEVE